MQALRAQRGALHDAEPVLLVDDHQPELAEADRILDQRVRADHQVDRSGCQLGLQLAPLLGGVAPVSSAMRNRDASSRRRMVMKCCSARISVGAMNATWKPFSIATSAAISATIVLPGADVSLQQPVHRLRPLHVVDDLGDHLFLIAGELERQHAARRLADLVGDDDRARLPLRFGLPPAQHQAELKQEELFEDQPPLRRRAKRVQLVDRRAGWWKVRPRAAPRGDRRAAAGPARRPAADRAAPPAARPAPGARARAASWRSTFRSSRRPARSVRCAASRRLTRFAGLGVGFLFAAISYWGFCICRPCDVSSSCRTG